jgi:GcrA cell cycle regulator/Sigma-70, region 4
MVSVAVPPSSREENRYFGLYGDTDRQENKGEGIMDWTEAEDVKLKAGIQNRMSARLIGEQLGKTRNSVLGRIFRLGLRLRLDGKNPPRPEKLRRAAVTTKLRRRPPKLNPSDYIDYIMDLRDMGFTFNEIAAQIGVSMPTVREWAIAFGGHQVSHNRYFTDEEIQYLVKAWRDHVHIEEMADTIGRSFGVVRQKILQMQRIGMLRDINRDPAKTRLLRVYGEKALTAGKTPSEALHNIAEAKRRAMSEAILVARTAATKHHKIAIGKMFLEIEAGKDRNQAIFDARAEGATLKEIGDALGMTRERVRQICFKHAEFIALKSILGDKS